MMRKKIFKGSNKGNTPSSPVIPKDIPRTTSNEENIDYNSNFNSKTSSDVKILRKAKHILQELTDTETTYVKQLKLINEGYITVIDRGKETSPKIPEKIKGHSDKVFATWECILDFHEQTILPLIENCRKKQVSFEAISELLNDMFSSQNIQLLEDYYFQYSKNLRSSFRLISEPGSNSWFKNQQRKLKHPLPLESYILIPVQRIGKYPLCERVWKLFC